MGDHANPRPVSGEIMTDRDFSPVGGRPLRAAEVLDAEYVTLEVSERAHVPHRHSGLMGGSGAASAGIGMLRKNGAPSAVRAVRGGPVFWLSGLLIAAGAFWVSGGHAVFDKAPLSLPSWTSKEPLRIEAVDSRIEMRNGRALLFVDGRIANDGGQERTVPPIAFDVAARSGRVMRYNLGTSGGTIAPGGSFAFSSRFEAPMEGVETVSVSFREN